MTLTTGYPPPNAFGLPSQFTEWRSHQVSAWQTILDAPTRFVAITAPTGAGKSLIYMTASALTDGRTVTLTGTKGLQNQLGYDYAEMGLLDIRGQSNYTCRAFEPGGEWQSLRPDDIKDRGCENGPCHVGLPCTLREAGCSYYDQIRMTLQADRVSTNYALWFAQKLYSKGLGEDLDLLVLDEAHVADAELSGALKIEFPHWLLKALSLKVPEGNVGIHGWQKWATYHAIQFKSVLDTKPMSTDKAALKYRQRLQKAERLLRSIMGMVPGEWVEDPTPDAYVFECLNPAKWAETVLFQGAGKVVFTSATLTEKTLTLLGVKPQDVTWFECPSDFPVERRPVIWVPTTKVDFKMTEAHWGQWVTRIDQILDQRPHVKGVIHTVSFARAKRLKEMSRHADRFILPGPGQTEGVVSLFRKTPEHLGAVLVSPSVMTGWDFPDSQCRFQILAKLPFPDTRSKITQARQELDKDYGPYLMMQNLVQAVGRGMRSKTDWCETIIVDDNWAWVQGKYKKLAPAWFWSAVRKSITLPAPLDPATFTTAA